jgi:hypothetical protein
MKLIANILLLLIATVYTIVGFHLIDFMERANRYLLIVFWFNTHSVWRVLFNVCNV